MQSARLGLVVGKRVLPEAHERNRVRRVLRETFRRKRSQLQPMDLVVQVIPDDVSSKAIRASFEVLLDGLREGCQ